MKSKETKNVSCKRSPKSIKGYKRHYKARLSIPYRPRPLGVKSLSKFREILHGILWTFYVRGVKLQSSRPSYVDHLSRVGSFVSTTSYPEMQNPAGFASTSAFQRTLGATNNPRASTPIRGTTPVSRRIHKDDTFGSEMDENAPPDPSRAVEDEIPQANLGVSRMVGALGQGSRADTPLTISALGTPPRQNLQLRSGASTLAGSVADPSTGTATPPRSRIVFRGDPSMVTTFDKKVDGELYDLWNA